MAKGCRCPTCGRPMSAQHATYEQQGMWVTYVCRVNACPSVRRGYPEKFMLFEDK